jgi:hypothetical protein
MTRWFVLTVVWLFLIGATTAAALVGLALYLAVAWLFA